MTTIRDATPSDADDIYRLLSGFVTSYRPDRVVFDGATFPQIIEAASDGNAEFLVAEQDSCVVGYLLAVCMPPPCSPAERSSNCSNSPWPSRCGAVVRVPR
ncbi:hypothetical protein [Streptomyces sp. NPDC059816]|uniref:hypothetical protein n=1 Tax=Streptomyces sp. NPDC059816 TaxID=3346960 RepID=UPI00364E85BE